MSQLNGRRPLLLPVTAEETAGFNAIPDAMAQVIGQRLHLPVAAGSVVQANKVGHTRADGWHRLVTPAIFAGEVSNGSDYMLIDDHVGFGGTLANLRGYVEHHGGHVIAMTTLTETREARRIAVEPGTLSMLASKHGQHLERLWIELFGHSLACLTNIEAGYLYRAEYVATIEDRMAAAAELARSRGLSPIQLTRRS